MPLPNLFASQVASITAEVSAYIETQRRIYAASATPLNPRQELALQAFVPASTINSTKTLVLAGDRVANPTFYSRLSQMGFDSSDLPSFTGMAAITFVDTVVSHYPFTDRLLFHELVHVVQYEKLGLEQFAARYVTGFLRGGSHDAIPLEVNAYALEAKFDEHPDKPFSVAAEVQSWINANRF